MTSNSPSQQIADTSLVTIGLPVYNNRRHVAQSIESLLGQTFGDFLLIISDNASTDGTAAICEHYAAADPRVKYFRNATNIGLYPNFNRVFELSQSKYFKWATGDDFSAPEMLADAVAVLERDPSIALCYPGTVIVDGDGREQGRYESTLNLMQKDPTERFLAFISNRGGLVNYHLGLSRAEAVRRTRLFGTHVGADVGFLAELALYGKFAEMPKYQFFRRFHGDSSSWNRGDEEQEKRRFHAANVRRIPFGTWRYHRAFWESAARSPLTFHEKARIMRRLLRYGYWDSRDLYEDLRRDLPPLLGFSKTAQDGS